MEPLAGSKSVRKVSVLIFFVTVDLTPGRGALEQSGDLQPDERRNAPTICCTLVLNLQPYSISGVSQCH